VLLLFPLLVTTRLEPNLESGANIDCCKLYRDNYVVRVSDALCHLAAAGLIDLLRITGL